MRIEDVFARFMDQVIEYLPSLAGGILLAIMGWAVAWFVKRVIIQVCTMLRLGRLLGRFRWAEGLTKADVRASLYSACWETSAAVVVFLVFLDAAFTAMRADGRVSGFGRHGLLVSANRRGAGDFGVGGLFRYGPRSRCAARYDGKPCRGYSGRRLCASDGAVAVRGHGYRGTQHRPRSRHHRIHGYLCDLGSLDGNRHPRRGPQWAATTVGNFQRVAPPYARRRPFLRLANPIRSTTCCSKSNS